MAAIELESTPLRQDSSLWHYYRMEGNSNDSKGSANGTDDTITYGSGSGMFGQGASFANAVSKIAVGGITSFNWSANNFSISVWANLLSGSADQYRGIFSNRFTDATAGWITIGTRDTGFLAVESNPGTLLTSSFKPVGNGWQHYVIVYTSSGSGLTLYRNGVVDSTGTAGTVGGTLNTCKMGTWVADTGQAWNGYIDDVAIFQRALTATEVSNLYNGTFANGAFLYNFV